MKFIEFIEERYVNLFTNDAEREKYKNEVYDLIQASYHSIGGIKGSGFESADAMVKKIPMWKLKKRNGKIVAGALYKDKNGRKSVCSFTDGTKIGKMELAKIMSVDGNRAYKEVSSVAEVKRIMSDEEIGKPDKKYIELYPELADFFYSRKIGNDIETKIAIGTLNITINKK